MNRSIAIGLLAASAAISSADYCEGNAAQWSAYATGGYSCSANNAPERFKEGSQSIRLDTLAPFETGLRFPAANNASWNLTTKNYIVFWTYGVNNNIGFQGPQPIVTLRSPSGTIRLTPSDTLVSNRAWVRHFVPIGGGNGWVRTTTGSPNLANITQFQVAFDTWDAAFSMYIDGLDFIQYTPGSLPPPGPLPPLGVCPNSITPRVLLFIYDPIMENLGSMRCHQAFGWQDPVWLTNQVVTDLRKDSHGLVRYQIVETQIVDEYPYHLDGFQYNDATYLADTQAHNWHSSGFDYARFLNEKGIAPRVASGDIDEVWVYGAPGFGFWESTIAGDGGYWCNSSPVQGVPSEKAFVVMGWNYERGVGEAIHSFCHRCESVMTHMYGSWPHNASNNWGKFTLLEINNAGVAGVGNCHYPPNGVSDYDYFNQRFVQSNCDDWRNYPNFQNVSRSINAREWSPNGVDPQREYLNWWYDHLPHFPSRGPDYFLNNWWRYLVDIDPYKAKRGSMYFSTGNPSVSVSSPGNGQTISGTTQIRASAQSDGAVGRVDFYVDGIYRFTDTVAPFIYEFDSWSVANGAHNVQARVYELQNGTEAISQTVNFSVQNGGLPLAIRPTLEEFTDPSRIPLRLQIWQGSQLLESRKVFAMSGQDTNLRTALPSGNYRLTLQGPRFLKQTANAQIPGDVPVFSLRNGDIDGDNEVTLQDYAYLAANFGRNEFDPNWNTPDLFDVLPSTSDLDGDGEVNLLDHAQLVANFGLAGEE